VALEAENQALSRDRQEAWQEGFEAGLKEGRASAESGRAETSAQFYAAPPANETEVEPAIERQEVDRTGDDQVAPPPAVDPEPAAEREVYVSQEWLSNHQSAVESQGALLGHAADDEDAHVDSRAEDHVAAQDFVDRQQYAADETAYTDELSGEEDMAQYAQSTDEYVDLDNSAADDSST